MKMSYFTRLFLQHPQSVGETYFTHFCNAFMFGTKLICFGCAEYIHAVVPGIDLFKCVGTASDIQLYKMAHELSLRQRDPVSENSEGCSIS